MVTSMAVRLVVKENIMAGRVRKLLASWYEVSRSETLDRIQGIAINGKNPLTRFL